MFRDPREYHNDPFDPRPIEDKERDWAEKYERENSSSVSSKPMSKKERKQREKMQQFILDSFAMGVFRIPNF